MLVYFKTIPKVIDEPSVELDIYMDFIPRRLDVMSFDGEEYQITEVIQHVDKFNRFSHTLCKLWKKDK